MNSRVASTIFSALMATVFFACDGGSSGFAGPSPSSYNNLFNNNGRSIGTSCVNGDSNRICLAVKYVAYTDSAGKAVLSSADAIKDIQGINQVWGQCNIAFEIEQFLPYDPKASRLSYGPANISELTDIRHELQEDHELLVVTTGTWDRSGSLGNTGANAWTSMPGENPVGAVLEQPVGTFANIIAHELGHYLSLDHVSDTKDLMNPVIYGDSTQLSQSQCAAARATANDYWSKMIRS